MQLYDKPAHVLHEMLKNKEISAVELTKAVQARADEVEGKVQAYLLETRDSALKTAADVDAKIARGEEIAFLEGIPGAIKDNICTMGVKTTCASRILENFVPPYNATVMNKLNAVNAVILGKLNMDEFAMGGSTENSAYHPTHNPWDIDCVPGGSSGGSAASVAAGTAIWSLGSDTGGSIRQPASYCGIVGMKPTYGRISRYGLVAFGSSLDQIGPMGRDALDLAAMLNVISGEDCKDQSSAKTEKVNLDAIANFDCKGKKIGIPEQYFAEGMDEDVREAVMKAIKVFEDNGATVEKFPMPIMDYAIPTYYIICCAEACSNLSRYDGIKYGFSPEEADDLMDVYVKSRSEGFGMEVKRRIMLGNFVLSSGYYDAYYNKALQAKSMIKKAFDEAFEKYDVVIGPVAPTAALKAGESLSDPLKMYLGDICTVLINIVGVPAISVPCGFTSEGLPVGMQLIGKHWDEEKLLGFTALYQRLTADEGYEKKSAVDM